MQYCRTPVIIAVLALVVGGCGAGATPRIGDAYPRIENALAFLAAIKPSVESAGVVIEPWTIGGNRLQTIQLNTEQATLFSDNRAVVGVVGHTGSRDALLGAAVYNVRGVPQVVPNATSRLIAAAGPWTFPLVPNDSIEGKFIADYALDSLHARRVNVLYLGDEYGVGLRDGVRAALRDRRIEIADAAVVPSQVCTSPANHEIYRAIALGSLRRSSPDVVVLAAGVFGSWCLTNIIHAADPNIWVLAADGMDVGQPVPADYSHVVPGRLRGVSFWTPGTDSLNRAFVELVRRHLQRDPSAGEALQYDAFMVLAAAAREVGNDRRAIRSWLASLGTSRPAWVGVTGAIAFNAPRTAILRMNSPQPATP